MSTPILRRTLAVVSAGLAFGLGSPHISSTAAQGPPPLGQLMAPRGYSAAIYSLDRSLGQPGRVTVRASEVSRDMTGIGDDIGVRVSFEFVNQTDMEIELSKSDLRLDWWRAGEQARFRMRPAAVNGDTEFEPGETGRVDAYWVVRNDPDAEEVSSLRVNWVFETDEQTSAAVAQVTVFTEDTSSGDYLFTPHFDPFVGQNLTPGFRLRPHTTPFRH